MFRSLFLAVAMIIGLFATVANAQFTVGGVVGGAPTAGVNCFGDADGKIAAYGAGWTPKDCGVYAMYCAVAEYPCQPANQNFSCANPADCTAKTTPSFAAISCGDAQVNVNYNCTGISATVGNGETISYSMTNAPSWLNISSLTGALSGIPTVNDFTDVSNLLITATAGTVSADSSPVAFTVEKAPYFTAISCPPAVTGTAYSCDLSAVDDDAGDKLTYVITGSESWMNFDNDTGALSGTPTGSADVSGLVVTVTDSVGLTGQSAGINFALNQAPVIAAISCSDATQDVLYSCSISATDGDGDSISYSLAGAPSWATINSSTGVISGTPDSAGDTTSMVVTATDSTTPTDSSGFVITVGPNNAGLATAAAASASAGTLTKAQLDTLLTNLGGTSGVDLTNAVNLDYVEHCVAAISSPTPQQIVDCAANATTTGAGVFNIAGKLNGDYSGAVTVSDLTAAGISSFDSSTGDQNVITFLNSSQCGSDFASPCSVALTSSICGDSGTASCQNSALVGAAGAATQTEILAYVRNALASYIVKVGDTATQASSQSGGTCGSVTVNGPAVCNNSAFTCTANNGWTKGSAGGFTNFTKSIGNIGTGNHSFSVTYTAKSWWGLPGYTRTVTQNLALSTGGGVTKAYSKHSFGARNDAIAKIAKACFAQSGNPTIMTEAQINATSGINFGGGYWFLPTSPMPASAWPNSDANPWSGGSLKYWFKYGSNPGFSSTKSLKVYYNYYGINTSNGKKLITRTDNDNFNPSGSVWCMRTACGN